MRIKDYRDLKITGIKFLRRVYTIPDMIHYFGYDDEADIVKEGEESPMMFSLGGTKEEFESFTLRVL
jgi:hypothetical protein